MELNGVDIILLVLLALLLTWAVRKSIKNHREGKGCGYACTGSCPGCEKRGRKEA